MAAGTSSSKLLEEPRPNPEDEAEQPLWIRARLAEADVLWREERVVPKESLPTPWDDVCIDRSLNLEIRNGEAIF